MDFKRDIIKHYQDTLHSLGCNEIIQNATRVCSTSSTLLDHFYTKNAQNDINFRILLSDLSDHFPIITAVWRSGSERRFYDDHDRKVDGSPPNLVSLLRPWIRCFTIIISA